MPSAENKAYDLGYRLAENLVETARQCGFHGVFGDSTPTERYSQNPTDILLFWNAELEEAATLWEPIFQHISQDQAFEAWKRGIMSAQEIYAERTRIGTKHHG